MGRPKKQKPYSQFNFILRGRAEICEFLRISINKLQPFIDKGAPVVIDGDVYIADKLALRQWMGVQISGRTGEFVAPTAIGRR